MRGYASLIRREAPLGDFRLGTIASLLRTNIHSVDTRADERINRLRDLFENGSTRTSESAGGADRDRTDDPRLAKPVLSQLSYSPF